MVPEITSHRVVPLCPVHGQPMRQESVRLTSAPTLNASQPSRELVFHCHQDGCTLYWSRQREHFDLYMNNPAYTNSTSNIQMRCPNPGHDCLYLAKIDVSQNRWTWNCSVCDFSYTDAPGAWANPPTLL